LIWFESQSKVIWIECEPFSRRDYWLIQLFQISTTFIESLWIQFAISSSSVMRSFILTGPVGGLWF
jgi:hypothetical protein